MRVGPDPTLIQPRGTGRTLSRRTCLRQDGHVGTPTRPRAWSADAAAAAVPPHAPGHPPLQRPREGRLVAGVCAGVARHLGLHPLPIRLGFVLTALVGAGIVAYGFLWAFVPEEDPRTPARPPAARRRTDPATTALLLGAALVAVGLAFLVQANGVDLRLDITFPLLVVAAGAGFVWMQLDETTRRRWLAREEPDRQKALARLGLGILLAVGGLIALATQGGSLADLWNTAVSVLVVLAGVGFIVAPWAMRLWNDLKEEQAARVRATERADIAAHLHDSVLQTLALIQRRADDPATVSRLARAQERELREWLYGGAEAGKEQTLASAVRAEVHEVEDAHGVPVDVVVTGDAGLDPRTRALVHALREAVLNAVRHGAAPVSVYVECGPDGVEAFVRDHGDGFDPADVPPDRLGVRGSILARMERHGGSASIRRREDGTEVILRLPPAVAEGATP